MTNKEKILIDLDSIKSVYKIEHENFKNKISEGYSNQEKFLALECFATDLDNFYQLTNKCIKELN